MVLARPHALLVAALLTTWLGWGSSFLAMRFTFDSMPPLLMMASRFAAAGLIALTLAVPFLKGRGLVLDARVVRDAALSGFGMVTVGMGATAWAAARLDTGITALLCASAPLWITALTALTVRELPHRLALLGLSVGVVGSALLAAPGSGSSVDLVALAALLLSTAAWAIGSVLAPRTASSGDALVDTGLRMLLGGVLLAPFALALGEGARLDLGSIDARAAASWTFLVLVCSVGGFLAYEWLLHNAAPTLATTYAFVNPVVAIALGAMVLDEAVTLRTVGASVAVVVAVVLLVVGERRQTAAPAAQRPPEQPQEVPAAPTKRRTAARRPMAVGRPRTGMGFNPTPTPSFAARRTERPWHATDGMDALAIDVALDRRL